MAIYYDKLSYFNVIKELVDVKENSDVIDVDPWYTFEEYMGKEVEELNWNFDDLMNSKTTN